MTAADACTLLTESTRQLDAARRDRDVYYLLAERLAFRLSDIAKELASERRRRYRLLEERRAERPSRAA